MTPGDHEFPMHRASRRNLVGLAFSGGGIRSATFNLGVLQALARANLLSSIDYLSTVSGGGYIGAWLYGWIARQPDGLAGVQSALTDPKSAGRRGSCREPIRYLREYSNYLTPRVGTLSADTWTMISTWIRNTALNTTVLVAALAAVLLFVRSAGALQMRAVPTEFLLYVAVAAFWIACAAIGGELSQLVAVQPPRRRNVLGSFYRAAVNGFRMTVVPTLFAVFRPADATPRVGCGQGAVQAVIACIFVAAATGSTYVSRVLVARSVSDQTLAAGVFVVLFGGLAWMLAFGGFGRCLLANSGRAGLAAAVVLHLALGAITAVIGAAIFYATACQLLTIATMTPIPHEWKWDAIAFGTPAMVLMVAIVGVTHVGLLGINFPDERREWTSRFGAWLLIYSVAWTAIFVAAVYVPIWIASAPWRSVGAAVVWIGSTVGGVVAGRGARNSAPNQTARRAAEWRSRLASLGMYVFVTGLIAAVSIAVSLVILRIEANPANLLYALRTNPWTVGVDDAPRLFVIGLIVAAVALALAFRVNVNEFSMHHFYKNRLVRCYLGASRGPWRKPNRFTGFDLDDDVKLAALRSPRAASSAKPPAADVVYAGPVPIINVALNLVKGDNLAWQERKAESFVFTPYYSGFAATEHGGTSLMSQVWKYAYRPTAQYAYGADNGPALGTAISISGAAANPNMGAQSSPAAGFLLTVFNARLGWWMGNPRRAWKWRRSSPANGLLYLVAELFGQTNDRGAFVNLSDGGHFENLGIYELVRRRCAVVIAADAEEDHDMQFGGLANAIRKCRIDFGVDIDIDVEPIRRGPDGFSRMHYAVGEIRYPSGPAGVLIYLKSSLTGQEPTDVLQYRAHHTQFPHESTGDQWFSESQFESYRALGEHIASGAFSAAAAHPATATVAVA